MMKEILFHREIRVGGTYQKDSFITPFVEF